MRLPWRNLAEGAGLVLALSFVFAIAFVPHLNTQEDPPSLVANAPAGEEPAGIVQLADAWWEYLTGQREGYRYTVHVDEHVHWVDSAGVQRHDTALIDFPSGDPHQEQGLTSLRGAVHERGYHVLVAQVQELTGISWLRLHQWLPALWLTFTAFAMYAALRPHPVAIPAAAVVGLIPTTARFLGPGMLVPIGFSLAWLPATLMLIDPARKRTKSAALLLAVMLWAFFVHLIGGFAAVALLAAGALLGAAVYTQEGRRSAWLLLAVAAVPLMWLYRTFTENVQTEIIKEATLPIDLSVFDGFGIPAILLWVLGVLLVVLMPPKRARTPIAACTAVSVAAFASIAITVIFSITNRYAYYSRWHPVFFLTASVPVAYAVVTLGRVVAKAWRQLTRKLGQRWLPTRASPVWGVAAGTLLLLVALSPATADHVEEPYYHVIEDKDWQRFKHIERNVGPEHEVFLAHPWKAPVLAALTGKDPYTYLQPGNPPINGRDYTDYLLNRTDLGFFVLNDITLVASEVSPKVGPFEQQREGVWTLPDDLAVELSRLRAR